jgi:hypothetical protein
MACVGHELTGPLMALYTHLKLARRKSEDPSLEAALRCLERMREITAALQVTGRVDDEEDDGDTDGGATELAGVLAMAASGLGRGVEIATQGAPPRVAGRVGLVVFGPALRAVARTAADGAALRVVLDGDATTARVRIDSGVAPEASRWRRGAPLASARTGLDLWLAALAALDAGGGVRVADGDGVIAVEVELPAFRGLP